MDRLPPGPRSRVLTTQRILARPFEWFPRWRDRYGDPFRVRTMNGNVTMTGQPSLLKTIFSADPDGYEPFAPRAVQAFVGPGSVLVISGKRHRRERKLLTPSFHGDRMRALGDIIADATVRHAHEAAKNGRTNLLEMAQGVSLEVIIRTVFGVQERARIHTFTRAIVDFMAAGKPALLFFTGLHRPWFPPWGRFVEAFKRFDLLLQEQIELTRTGAARDDTILSLMLAARYDDGEPMADSDVRDQLRTLLLAGHETSSVALAWAIDHLHRSPALLAQTIDEIDRLDGSAKAYAESSVLENLWKETLRLHPPATEALRELNRPLELGDYRLPAGEAVGASILLVHMDGELYANPTVFDPSRFEVRRYGANEFIPFGGGHRRCLGAAFAAYEMKIALGSLLANHALTLVESGPPPPERRNVVLAPRGGVPVTLEPRRPGDGARTSDQT